MNPVYPPQPYQPSGPPPPYNAPANTAQPPPIGFNPNLYATPQPAYAPTTHYAAVAPPAAPPSAQPTAQPPPYQAPAYSSAPAPAPVYMTQATVPYNASGAYSPGQPTYISPQQPVSNLTVVQPARTVYVANPTPAVDASLGFLAGAALASGHHHHHYGYSHHGVFGHHHHHHGVFGHHHGFHHC